MGGYYKRLSSGDSSKCLVQICIYISLELRRTAYITRDLRLPAFAAGAVKGDTRWCDEMLIYEVLSSHCAVGY